MSLSHAHGDPLGVCLQVNHLCRISTGQALQSCLYRSGTVVVSPQVKHPGLVSTGPPPLSCRYRSGTVVVSPQVGHFHHVTTCLKHCRRVPPRLSPSVLSLQRSVRLARCRLCARLVCPALSAHLVGSVPLACSVRFARSAHSVCSVRSLCARRALSAQRALCSARTVRSRRFARSARYAHSTPRALRSARPWALLWHAEVHSAT